MIETMDRRLGELDGKVDRRLSDLDTKVDRRMESASQTSQKIHERLGKVGEATDQMLERAKDLARLEQALRPPKARGGFGEYLLGTLLADIFPPDKYELQYGFRGGERVDAVIRIDRSLVPVDAKFPLDNFQRIAAGAFTRRCANRTCRCPTWPMSCACRGPSRCACCAGARRKARASHSAPQPL